jgi:hypothetical protein
MIRRLQFGSALLLLRSARPIVLEMTPWTARRDAAEVKDGRVRAEQTIRDEASREWSRHA